MNIDITKFFEVLKEKTSLLTILGVTLIVIGALGGLPLGQQSSMIMAEPWRYMLAVTGVILLLIGLFLMLRQEKKSSAPNHQIKDGAGNQKILFLKEFPESFHEHFLSSKDIWLIGVTLSSMIKDNYRDFEEKLRKGHRIRILLVHPEGASIEMAASRFFAERNRVPQVQSNRVLETLTNFCDLKKVSPSNLEIRTIKNPLTFGARVIDPDSSSGKLYLEHYPFRVVSTGMPKIVLDASDGEWYEFFLKEIQSLWNAGNEWECK